MLLCFAWTFLLQGVSLRGKDIGLRGEGCKEGHLCFSSYTLYPIPLSTFEYA